MSTTITIDKETKEELLRVAAKLQARLKRKINYNDAIKFLLEQEPRKQQDINMFKEACERVRGIDPGELIEALHDERRHDDK